MNIRRKAIFLFTKHAHYSPKDIKSFKKIHNGFTNISYKATVSDGCSFQVRMANDGGKIDRISELRILKIINDRSYIYFDVKTGNAIKKWIDGENPPPKIIHTKNFLKKFARQLLKLHSTTISGLKIKKHHYYDCIKKAKLPKKHHIAYITHIKDFEKLPMVLSHNDLSSDNLLWLKNQEIHFIDYEWARLNNEYWDIANFIREVNLPINKIRLLASYMGISDLRKLLKFIYLTTNYAYQWTFNMPVTTRIKNYRDVVCRKMNKYYKYIIE